jgi:cobalt-zinc-cadmium efflux system membrane fusion protein
MRYISLLIYSLCILIFSSCGSKKIQPEEENSTAQEKTLKMTDAQTKNSGITFCTLVKRNISSSIKVNGKIDVPPQNMVSVSMPLGGFLKTMKLLPGMPVHKGEIIATMEDLQYIQLQQEYLGTKSKLVYAEKEFLRQQELNQSKASSDKVFQQTQNEYTMNKISVKALAEKLKLINIDPGTLTENSLSKAVNIYAPITGFVTKVNVNIGKYVNPSDILFELIDPSDIHLNLKVFEKDLEKLAIGQKVEAYNNLSDKKYTCEIILISQDLSAERAADVHCHFQKYDKSLVPGMYMNADIEVKKNNTDALPEEAIVNFEGKEYIMVADSKNQFTLTPVQTGSTEDGYIEITDGKRFAGKSIVWKGAYVLLMAMKNTAKE